MTAKEKAHQLFCKMYGCEINKDPKDIYILNGDGYFIAKDCALISVDEILNILSMPNIPKYYPIVTDEYWQEVKSEINNL